MTMKQVVKYIPFGTSAAAAKLAAMQYVGNSHLDECYEAC
jgi:hypothetical protein